MIDMHSHILPGVDDGSADLAESLEMLRLSVQDGVRTQVLTPHIQPDRYGNTRETLEQAFASFVDQVARVGMEIELRLAAEVRIGPEVLQLARSDGIPWLGEWDGMRVFLMEFPHNQLPAGSINLVNWLIAHGVLPMIAHPERNRELQCNPAKLAPFLEAGCLVQITAGSLLGAFGPEAHRASVELLRARRVTLIATDCHNLPYRPPVLGKGFRAAAEIVGRRSADELVRINPERLLDGKP